MMRAEICDSDDAKAVEKFRAVLRDLGTKLIQKDWVIGVDFYDLKIGEQHLKVFSGTQRHERAAVPPNLFLKSASICEICG